MYTYIYTSHININSTVHAFIPTINYNSCIKPFINQVKELDQALAEALAKISQVLPLSLLALLVQKYSYSLLVRRSRENPADGEASQRRDAQQQGTARIS